MKLYNFVCSVLRVLVRIVYRYEVIGEENVPEDGNLIIISNHRSFLDPVFMLASVKRRRIIPVAKEELFKIPVLRFLMKKLEVIPINRDNPGLSTIKSIIAQIKKGRALGIYPEGTRADKGTFLPAKPGVTLFMTKTKSTVLPMSIITSYVPFTKCRVVIGKPIDTSEYLSRKIPKEEYTEISQRMFDVVVENHNKYNDNIVKMK